MANSGFCKWLLVASLTALMACSSPQSGNSGAKAQECTSIVDCEYGQLCVDDPSGKSSTGKICTDPECTTNEDCDSGECVDNKCIGGGTTDGDCEGGCPEGQVCDPTIGECTAEGKPAPTGACQSCDVNSDESDCPEGLSCAVVGPSPHCVPPCSSNADCSSGWICGPDGSGPNCVPGIFKCSDCLVNGCEEEGTVCYADSGVCGPLKKTCEVCTKDGQCGPGKRCHGKGGTKYCVPQCDNSECPNNGNCVTNASGVGVCEWKNPEGPCCLGDNCGGPIVSDPCDDIECTGNTLQCKGGKCVECTENDHCESGNCKPDNVCGETTQQCSGSTPIWNQELGQCCQCSGSTHCSGNPCDGCTCKAGSNDSCDTCTPPYPGCAEYDGQWVCVQCSEDSHCATQKCDTNTWTCDGGGGPPTTGNCQSEGCTNPAQMCDQESGLCYNPNGNCDDVTEFCPNGGKCIGQLEAMFACLPGGGMGGLPGLPGGAAPNAGNCDCDLMGGIPGQTQGNCSSGLVCGPDPFAAILAIFAALQGQTCNPPNTCQAP